MLIKTRNWNVNQNLNEIQYELQLKYQTNEIMNEKIMNNKRHPILIFVAIFTIAALIVPTGVRMNRIIDINLLTMDFNKTDAQFTVNYNIGVISKMYIMLLGGKSIEPVISEVFSNFNFTIVKIDQDKTILHVHNISRYEKNVGYYLHDPVKFGIVMKKVEIYVPGDVRPKDYVGINATPALFYR